MELTVGRGGGSLTDLLRSEMIMRGYRDLLTDSNDYEKCYHQRILRVFFQCATNARLVPEEQLIREISEPENRRSLESSCMLIYSRRAAASGDLARSKYTEGERERAPAMEMPPSLESKKSLSSDDATSTTQAVEAFESPTFSSQESDSSTGSSSVSLLLNLHCLRLPGFLLLLYILFLGFLLYLPFLLLLLFLLLIIF